MTTPTIKRLKLDELVVDKRFQRPLDEARAAKIAQDFDPVLCGVLEVSSGTNGTYSVFDGQHRIAALRLLGEEAWPCRIHAITAKEAALAFVRTQTERRPVHPIDRHKASVFAGDMRAMKIDALVRTCGYRIENTHTPGSLTCPYALYKSYEVYGPDALRLTLKVIEDAWGVDDHFARKGSMVRGMSLLLKNYVRDMDMASFVEKLTGTSSAQILRQASAERHVGASGTSEYVLVARQLLELYNAQRRHLTDKELAEGKTSKRLSPRLLGRGS